MNTPAEDASTIGERIQTKPPLIVIAEDDDEMRALLADALREDGYDVLEASNGDDLLDLLDSPGAADSFLEVDLILSDIRMPGPSGLEVVAAMQGLRSPIPVILITAFGNPAVYAQAKALGVAAMFDKPFEIADLQAKVRQLVPPVPLG